RREPFRADDRSDPRDGSVGGHRSARPGFSRGELVYPDRAPCRARHFQSQPGNRGAIDAAGAFAREIPDIAGGVAPVETDRAEDRDQEWGDARSWRKGAGTFPDDG